MADLLLPLMLIIIMFLLIDALDTSMPLIIIGGVFMPIAWVLYVQIINGEYDTLCGAAYTAYVSASFVNTVGVTGFIIPIAAGMKIIYVKGFIAKDDAIDGGIR